MKTEFLYNLIDLKTNETITNLTNKAICQIIGVSVTTVLRIVKNKSTFHDKYQIVKVEKARDEKEANYIKNIPEDMLKKWDIVHEIAQMIKNGTAYIKRQDGKNILMIKGDKK